MKDTTPEGKFMASVKVGPKGQIVIPKEARDMFGIKPGDTIVVLADKNRGIAIQQYSVLEKIMSQTFIHGNKEE